MTLRASYQVLSKSAQRLSKKVENMSVNQRPGQPSLLTDRHDKENVGRERVITLSSQVSSEEAGNS